MAYIWELSDWPNFSYNKHEIQGLLYRFAETQGRLSGILKALPEDIQEHSLVELLAVEAIKTSEIEGEFLSQEDVLSSIRNHLGLHRHPEKIKDRRASGISQLMVISRETFSDALTEEMLFKWHQIMMEPYLNINKGCWRKGHEPMQIVSGAIGKEIVHFQAPPSDSVEIEMQNFIKWFNETGPSGTKENFDAPIRSAVAHLYFESIHPFEDGNGRIGRAISEKALSQGLKRPVLLSLSKAISKNRKAYYDALKAGQRSLEITPWINYFTETVIEAQRIAETEIELVLNKHRFFQTYFGRLNPRQEKVINRMFEAGTDGFKGGMSAKKYMSIAKTSKATATRDLADLVEKKAIKQTGIGRSTRYSLREL